jgi:hypothetical protein
VVAARILFFNAVPDPKRAFTVIIAAAYIARASSAEAIS